MSLAPSPPGLRLAAALVAAATALLGGCGGDKFSACDACGDAAAGTAGAAGRGGTAGSGGSSGRGGSGGATGGASGTGGAGGSGGTAGTAGTAGSGGGGSAGTSNADGGPEFPRTRIRDDFNAPDGPPQQAWIGNRDSYSVAGQKLAWIATPGHALLWETPFGVEQEVFATLAAINTQSDEINLVLKAQQVSDCELLEVMYDPGNREIRLVYCTEGVWHPVDDFSITLQPGDQLGARFLANNQLHIYVNAVRTAIFDASAYPHAALPGRIGVNCEGIADGTTAWDDFGGG